MDHSNVIIVIRNLHENVTLKYILPFILAIHHLNANIVTKDFVTQAQWKDMFELIQGRVHMNANIVRKDLKNRTIVESMNAPIQKKNHINVDIAPKDLHCNGRKVHQYMHAGERPYKCKYCHRGLHKQALVPNMNASIQARNHTNVNIATKHSPEETVLIHIFSRTLVKSHTHANIATKDLQNQALVPNMNGLTKETAIKTINENKTYLHTDNHKMAVFESMVETNECKFNIITNVNKSQ